MIVLLRHIILPWDKKNLHSNCSYFLLRGPCSIKHNCFPHYFTDLLLARNLEENQEFQFLWEKGLMGRRCWGRGGVGWFGTVSDHWGFGRKRRGLCSSQENEIVKMSRMRSYKQTASYVTHLLNPSTYNLSQSLNLFYKMILHIVFVIMANVPQIFQNMRMVSGGKLLDGC